MKLTKLAGAMLILLGSATYVFAHIGERMKTGATPITRREATTVIDNPGPASGAWCFKQEKAAAEGSRDVKGGQHDPNGLRRSEADNMPQIRNIGSYPSP